MPQSRSSKSALFRYLFLPLLILLLLLAAAALWMRWYLGGSLAPLTGEQILTGLSADVVVERDEQGIPTISASSREDAAFALGVLHAQERFFQMDLMRRQSAGELSAVAGEPTLESDRRIRVHQFRKRAERALANVPQAQMRILQRYSEGVNAGLNALDKPPFEYLILRTEPQPWQPADSLLVLYAMYIDLQPEWNEHERSLEAMRDLLPQDWFQFLVPEGGYWDSPIHGQAHRWDAPLPEQPLAELYQAEPDSEQLASAWQYRDSIEIGSNNWSVSGKLSPYQAGTVANDMHLQLRAPNIWYRASWLLPEEDRRITGATLPGTPAMVVGSNERIAWGFTNSGGDYHDSIILQTNAERSAYRTAEGWEDFVVETETIAVSGGEPETIELRLTRWGPVIGEDHRGNLLALRWVAHDSEGANLNLLRLEQADNIYEALDIAASSGTPGQNFNVVDHQGNQAWTILGRLPRRVGFVEAGLSPRMAGDWSDGQLAWDGYLEPGEYPRIINPEHGRIWTANARIVSDDLLQKVGVGDYALGARQQQIEKALFSSEQWDEKALLALALDNRAIFLERWQQLLLATIDEDPQLADLKPYVQNWGARAAADSVGYLVVKLFRSEVIDNTVGGIIRHVDSQLQSEGEPVFWPEYVDSLFEYPVWALVDQQPTRHLPNGYQDWPTFLRAMAANTLRDLTAEGKALGEQTWGSANTLAIEHPLSGALPDFISKRLNMPPESMPGDTYMPYVQAPSTGASERMVVTPGHEQHGIFHMATGQSGHPLSPYYDKGHRDWVEGRPSPFLPGETKWRMVLKPSR